MVATFEKVNSVLRLIFKTFFSADFSPFVYLFNVALSRLSIVTFNTCCIFL
jgi:hypothetical protein